MTTDRTFADQCGPWAVVAGGSDGTGAAFSRELARRGVNVAIVARRAALLDELAAELRAECGVEARAVVADLADDDALAQVRAGTDDLEVGCLVYNAGTDERLEPFLDVTAADHRLMVLRNCVTVMETAHHFGAPMVTRGRGGVILVSSGTAWVGTPRVALYGATKAFDLVLGEALWAEWRHQGVDVLSLVLGTTDTPALHRVIEQGLMPMPSRLADPEWVAQTAFDHLADGPTYVMASRDHGTSPFGGLSRREAVELVSGGGDDAHRPDGDGATA